MYQFKKNPQCVMIFSIKLFIKKSRKIEVKLYTMDALKCIDKHQDFFKFRNM